MGLDTYYQKKEMMKAAAKHLRQFWYKKKKKTGMGNMDMAIAKALIILHTYPCSLICPLLSLPAETLCMPYLT